MSETTSPRPAPGLGQLWLTALFPLLNLCLFVPATIYLANLSEFEVGPLRLILPLAIAAVLAALALATLLRLLPVVLRRLAMSMLFGLGLLSWVQGAFLMHDYGPLDGRGIDWLQFGSLVGADLLLWLAVLAGSVVLARRLAPVAAFASAIFIGIQAVPLVLDSDRILAESGQFEPPGDIPDEILAYSQGRNIVHVVLDNFQSDVFVDLVEELGLEAALDGFIVFPENTAVAPHTSLAVPAIVSGRLPDGSQTPDEYFRTALTSGFHSRLLDAGYRVKLLPMLDMSGAPHTDYFPVPNTYAGGPGERRLREAARLLDVALFRLVPHPLRRWVYNEDNWRVSALLPSGGSKNFEQRRFLADYIDRINASEEAPAYHFLHLWPPHPPFSTDASGRPAGEVLPATRENYLNEARPMVRLLARFVARLKALGIYDQSLIIFQSDHGGGFEPDHMPARLLGLMAVKPPGSRGALRTSQVQSSMADLPATLVEQAGLGEFSGPGTSILSIEPGDRQRRFVFMHDGELHSLGISGSVSDPDSFGAIDHLVTVERSRAYRPGKRVLAGLVGEGGRYLGEGWSSQDDRLVWNNGHEATLQLELPPVEGDLVLGLEFIPNVDPDRHPAQRISAEVNGRLVGEWVAEEKRGMRVRAPVPGEWLDRSLTEIRLILPDAASPAELGSGSDTRTLGVALTAFSLVPASQDGHGEPGG